MSDDDDDSFTFGDFKFAPPSPPPPQPSSISSSQHNNFWDDDSFFSSAPNTSSSPSPQPRPPAPPPPPPLPFFFEDTPEKEKEKETEKNESVSKQDDLFGKLGFQRQQIKPGNGSSFDFGGSFPISHNHENFDFLKDGKNGGGGDLFGGFENGVGLSSKESSSKSGGDLLWKFEGLGQEIKSDDNELGFDFGGAKEVAKDCWVFSNHGDQQRKGPGGGGVGLDFGGGSGSVSVSNDVEHDEGEGEGEWEFMGAFSGSGGGGVQGKLEGGFVSSQPINVVVSPEKQAGRGTSTSPEHKPVSISLQTQSHDLFAGHAENVHQSNSMGVGLDFNYSPAVANGFMTSGFMPDLFSGVEEVKGSEISAAPVHEDDDFGDFVDANQEFGSSKEDPDFSNISPPQAQTSDGSIQDIQTPKETSKGALPLSLFSDVVEESSDNSDRQDELVDKPVSNPQNGFDYNGPGLSIHDLISNLYSQAQQSSSVDTDSKPPESGVPPPEKLDSTALAGDDEWDDNSEEFKVASSDRGVVEQLAAPRTVDLSQELRESSSSLQFDVDLSGNVPGEDDGEWEFMGAFPESGVLQGNLEGNLATSQPQVVTSPEKQAGLDASVFSENKPASSSPQPQFVDLFVPQSVDLFAPHTDKDHQLGSDFNGSTDIPSGIMSNNFEPDLFFGAEEVTETEMSAIPVYEDDDYNDFGDFIDSNQGILSNKQDQLFSDGLKSSYENLQDTQTQRETSGGVLPLSLFDDVTEESSDYSHNLDNSVDKAISKPINGYSANGPGLSIHDLISNLYSQAEQTSSVDDDQKPPGNSVSSSDKMDPTVLSRNDDWDDNSWEFEAAYPDTVVREQPPVPSSGNASEELCESFSSRQLHLDFYHKLRDGLCCLLSHQIDEEKSSNTIFGDVMEADAVSKDIQEASELLEHLRSSQGVHSGSLPDKNTCLSEALEVLQGPKFNVVDTEYGLSRRLQSALNDWRISIELLRHAVSVLQILSLGTAEEQFVYISTWSKIFTVCVQELKDGSMTWKKALEKNLEHQLLCDNRGQQYIQALGHVIKVVEVLGLSAELYKPWLVFSMSEPPQVFSLLDECRQLWSSSGLKEALQNLSDNGNFGCSEAAKALVAAIKNVEDLHDPAFLNCVSTQHDLTCRLSLLPHEVVPDLKTVLWNGELYIVTLANLWANLVNSNPPQLPRLQAI